MKPTNWDEKEVTVFQKVESFFCFSNSSHQACNFVLVQEESKGRLWKQAFIFLLLEEGALPVQMFHIKSLHIAQQVEPKSPGMFYEERQG